MKNQFVKIEPKYFNRRAVWINVNSIVRIDEYKAGEIVITISCYDIDLGKENIGDSNLTMFTLCCTPEQFLEKLEQ